MEDLRLDGRVAVVTGAGRGMGAAFARELARRGAKVVVNDLGAAMDGSGSDATPAEQVAAEIAEAGGEAVADAHSVSTTEGAEGIVATALERFGRVDVVVNNAGILRAVEFPETDLDDFLNHLSVHLVGAFNVSRAAWPHLLAQRSGRIVNLTSSSFFGSVVSVSYSAAKAGLIGLTRTLALIGAEHDIKVNAIAPAASTRMSGRREALENGKPELPPELVAEAVAFLAHASCPVTGELFGVGGGKIDRVVLAAGEGYVAAGEFTAETIRDHWDTVMDIGRTWLPASSFDHVLRLTRA